MSEDLLRQWELEAKESIYGPSEFPYTHPIKSPLASRILALISLVREKDFALQLCCDLDCMCGLPDVYGEAIPKCLFHKAIALTDQLK